MVLGKHWSSSGTEFTVVGDHPWWENASKCRRTVCADRKKQPDSKKVNSPPCSYRWVSGGELTLLEAGCSWDLQTISIVTGSASYGQ